MAWKRLERLTRSADVPATTDAAGVIRDGSAPERPKKAKEQKKAKKGPPSKTKSQSKNEQPAEAESEHSGVAIAPAKPRLSANDAPETVTPKKPKGEEKPRPAEKPEKKPKTKKRADAAARVSPEEVDRLVDEGMMIVRSALRMSTKNRLIMQVLGSHENFDEDALIRAVRIDAEALAEEKSEEAQRLELIATKAARKPGRATFHDDYRRQDVRALTLREQVGHETARRLHDFSQDDEALRALIHSARESALDDVIQARLSAVMPYRRDPAYRRERGERMRALADDLAVLHRRQKARLGDRIS